MARPASASETIAAASHEGDEGCRNPPGHRSVSVSSGDNPIVTGKIALAHLTEFPDYCTRLAVLEREAADHLSTQK